MGAKGVLILMASALVLSAAAPAFASDDKPMPVHDESMGTSRQSESDLLGSVLPTTFSLPASEIYQRTQAVLKHFNMPEEPDYQTELSAFARQQSESGLKNVLPYFDTQKGFGRFSAIVEGTFPTFYVYRDADSKQVVDFAVELNQKSAANEPAGVPAVQSAATLASPPSAGQPLAGLRIALDPGHMGSPFWDEETGKFVDDHHGHRLSEGVLNLQVCLLLKERFEKLGASVMVTHETLGPVEKNITLDNLKLSDFAPQKLAAEALQPWFISLLEEGGPAGPKLFSAFERSPEVKKIFSDFMKSQYFIEGADLEARVKLIEAFKPDLTLIVHFDTSDPPGDTTGVNPGRHDFTKVYVPGGFEVAEFATRESRAHMAMHMLDVKTYAASLALAKSLLTQLKSKLSLQGDDGVDGTGVAIEPGLQARNLYLTRHIQGTALAFAECLYYNDREEFQILQNKDHAMMIGGTQTYYSNRLVTVADALEAGVINFAANQRSQPANASLLSSR